MKFSPIRQRNEVEIWKDNGVVWCMKTTSYYFGSLCMYVLNERSIRSWAVGKNHISVV